MKRNFFLTLDLEEWYHLEYLTQKIEISDRKNDFIEKLDDFFDILKINEIQITIFVLGELAQQNPDLIKKLSNDGHEIGCHGLDHDLLYNKSPNVFKEQIVTAKKILEDIIGKEVQGYRASCFSMDREKLEILMDANFKYDSSFIKFSEHSLYSDLDLTGFDKIEDLVYRYKKFYEFEIPTLDILNKNIPISGGGYFRLFPSFLYKYLFNKYKDTHNNFVFYIHPFELTNPNFQLKNIPLKDKLRFQIGRKRNLKNFSLFLNYIKPFYTFRTFLDYINEIK